MPEITEDTAISVNVATREVLVRPDLSPAPVWVDVGPTRFRLEHATVNEKGQVELRGLLVSTDSETSLGTAESVTESFHAEIAATPEELEGEPAEDDAEAVDDDAETSEEVGS